MMVDHDRSGSAMSPLSKEQSPTFKENLPSQPTDIPLEGVLLLLTSR
jgi:hypothetical protein